MFNKKQPMKASQHSKTDIIDKNSPSPFIEGYRSLRTNLSFATFSGEIKTIMVTSSIPGEGKSSVSINLARTLSMSGKKVLLIDGDLRSPSVHKYLRVRKKEVDGFSSVLVGRTKIEDAIYTFPPLEIDVVLAGPIPPNAPELLSRQHTQRILNSLKEKYDTIIIDTPPVGVLTDPVIMSNYVDGVLFVVKQNYAHKDMIRKSLNLLQPSGVKILGVVLNDYQSSKNFSSSGAYDYQYDYGDKPEQI